MRHRMLFSSGRLLAAVGMTISLVGSAAAGQTASAPAPFKIPTPTYTPAKTPWGDPDIQGVWDNHSTVPLERPARLGDKKTYTDAELANMRGFRAGSAGRTNTASSIDQLDRVRAYDDFWGQAEGVKDNRTAQIEDPANGRIPPLTPAAKKAQEEYLATHPSTDEGSGGDVTHWDGFDTRTRCIAIQVPAGVMSYNSASYIMQSPGWVMIALERLNTRTIPIGPNAKHHGIRNWLGDSIGHWEGNTLVVETINFLDRPSQGGGGSVVPNGISQGNVKLVEHFVPVGPKRLEYYATLEDANTWTQPWTFMQPWEKDPIYQYDQDGGKIGDPEPYQLFEYACHEGNRSIGVNLKSANDRIRAAKNPVVAPAAADKSTTVAALMGLSEADIRAKYGAPLATNGPRWQYSTTDGVFVVFVFFENGKVVRVRPDNLALDEIAKTGK